MFRIYLSLLLALSSNFAFAETLWRSSTFKSSIFNSDVAVWEAGNANSPALLLIHGLGQTAHHDWDKVVPFLSQRFFVRTLDLPGFGQSATPEKSLTPTAYALLLTELIGATGAPVTVIGHSMGAVIALRYTEQFPQRVGKLILVDAAGVLNKVSFMQHFSDVGENRLPFPIPPLSALQRKLRNVASTLLEGPERLFDLSQIVVKHPALQRQFFGDKGDMEAAIQMISEDLSSAIYNITTDTHIIWGINDTIAPLRTAELLSQRMQNAYLHIVNNAGHIPMNDNPQEFIRQINSAFLLRTTEAKIPLIDAMKKSDFHCNDQHNIILTGHYELVTLNNCHNIKLSDAVVQKLQVVNSTMSAYNTAFNMQSTPLLCDNSYIEITAGKIQGKELLALRQCRIDLAGVDLQVTDSIATIHELSSIRFSVSRLLHANTVRYLHKNYRVQQTKWGNNIQ